MEERPQYVVDNAMRKEQTEELLALARRLVGDGLGFLCKTPSLAGRRSLAQGRSQSVAVPWSLPRRAAPAIAVPGHRSHLCLLTSSTNETPHKRQGCVIREPGRLLARGEPGLSIKRRPWAYQLAGDLPRIVYHSRAGYL